MGGFEGKITPTFTQIVLPMLKFSITSVRRK